MTWHYRALKRKLKDGSVSFTVVEYYQNIPMKDGKLGSLWTTDITPMGETKEELVRDLLRMARDIKKNKAVNDRS